MKERVEIVASGFGGQGVVRLGQVLGEAAVKQGLYVTMLKSHGTEMRGGYVRSQVVVSTKMIDSPMCETPDYFLSLSLGAYKRFSETVPEDGMIVYDPSFVDEINDNLPCKQVPFPAKDIAVENFGRTIFSNSVALGAMAKLLEGVIDKETVLESLLDVIPKFHEDNRKAFQIGYEKLDV